MKKSTIITAAVVCVISACSNNEQPAEPHALVGTWKNDRMKVKIKSMSGNEVDTVMDVTPETWKEKMGVEPIITTYKEDGTYNSEHRKLSGELFYNPAGKWEIIGDSIMMQDIDGQKSSYKYKLKVEGDVAEFWGMEDMDGDGAADDIYYSRQTRVKTVE